MADVVADTNTIRKIGKLVIDMYQQVDELTVLIKNPIKPGSAQPEAQMLLDRYALRVTGGAYDALVTLRDALWQMGNQLIKTAALYDSVEDLNDNDVERLRGIVGSVQKFFPDFNPFPADAGPQD